MCSLVMVAILTTLTAASQDDGFSALSRKAKTPWTAILYGVVSLAGIAVVGFKNSKRTHLD